MWVRSQDINPHPRRRLKFHPRRVVYKRLSVRNSRISAKRRNIIPQRFIDVCVSGRRCALQLFPIRSDVEILEYMIQFVHEVFDDRSLDLDIVVTTNGPTLNHGPTMTMTMRSSGRSASGRDFY